MHSTVSSSNIRGIQPYRFPEEEEELVLQGLLPSGGIGMARFVSTLLSPAPASHQDCFLSPVSNKLGGSVWFGSIQCTFFCISIIKCCGLLLFYDATQVM